MFCSNAIAKNFTLASPNGRLKALVNVDKAITYQVTYNGKRLLAPSQISMTIINPFKCDSYEWKN